MNRIVSDLNRVEDFRGDIIARVYLEDGVADYRTQVMRSGRQSMTRNVGDSQKVPESEAMLLNSIPWIYLPPDYSFFNEYIACRGGR